jgi:ligand-binding sensor domain-containing protein
MRSIFLPVILLICYSGWGTTNYGNLSKFDDKTWTMYFSSFIGSSDINCISIDNKGTKWIGTLGAGLAKFDDYSWAIYHPFNSGLPNAVVRAIAIDASGNTWIGTGEGVAYDTIFEGGLAKFNGTSWTIYNASNSGLPDYNITAITIDGSGTKWIGAYSDGKEYDGLVKFDNTNWTVYSSTNSGLPNNYITSIAIDDSGNKWIGTKYAGLAKFDGTAWTVYNTSNSGLPNNGITSIAVERNGNKWIGTLGGGIVKFDGTKWTIYNHSNSGLPDNSVESVAIDADGNKWVGTFRGGLAKFDGTTWIVYDTSNSELPQNWVSSIAIDSSGNKWIGTSIYYSMAIKVNRDAALKLLTPLGSNYPNPFKQKTFISYNILENGPVSLRIYTLDGYLVQTLVNAKQTIGHYTVSWDGANDKGKIMAHGMYMYRLTSNSGIFSKKMNFIE